jgi:hypothetical protein
MLESRLVHTSLMGSNLAAQVVGGCPQGGGGSSISPFVEFVCC